MARRPHREIQAAILEPGVGPVKISELISMPNDKWGLYRDRITDHRRGKPHGIHAKCLLCGHPVFISVRKFHGKSLPYFKHFGGDDIDCPWYSGRIITPDAARANQYRGRQEGIAHRLLCEKIAELISFDDRSGLVRVDEYMPPTANEFGRYPDVAFEWSGKESVIELQLSHTFETEISARCVHYEREGKPIIWVMYGIDPSLGDLAQNMQDIVRRHRGNAFVIDQESITASYEQRTLVLKCYFREVGSEKWISRLVQFGSLIFPGNCVAYFQDCLIAPRLEGFKMRRAPWFKALKSWDHYEISTASFEIAFKSLPLTLSDKFNFARLIATVFSLVSHAKGQWDNFATRHPNARAMLNDRLNNHILAGYESVIWAVLEKSNLGDLRRDLIVVEHFRRAMSATRQIADDENSKALRYLLPELLDVAEREELSYFSELPVWANPQ